MDIIIFKDGTYVTKAVYSPIEHDKLVVAQATVSDLWDRPTVSSYAQAVAHQILTGSQEALEAHRAELNGM
jgi:hypothetical protein